jgi:short-subunit dehydrogenase
MNIVVTGSNSGIGQALCRQITATYPYKLIGLSRQILDLSDINAVESYCLPTVDMLINCAGTDLGGKIDFAQHKMDHIRTIMTTNLLSTVLLSHKALNQNSNCKIVNITSTNNKQYWPNNLTYSLSKQALSLFGNMLQVDYPAMRYLEVRLGLTSTNFNQNRYQACPERFTDIYQDHAHLTAAQAAHKILSVLFDDNIKFVEVSP